MQRSTEPPTLERLITGERCDEKGCYDIAIWLVSFDQNAFHWCVKHTRSEMRDKERWGAPYVPTLDG